MTAVHDLCLQLVEQTRILERKVIQLRIESCLHLLSDILVQLIYENREEIHEKIKSQCPSPIVLGKFVYSEMLGSGELNIQHKITDTEDWIVICDHSYFSLHSFESHMLMLSDLGLNHIFGFFLDCFRQLNNLYDSFILEKGKVTEQNINVIEESIGKILNEKFEQNM